MWRKENPVEESQNTVLAFKSILCQSALCLCWSSVQLVNVVITGYRESQVYLDADMLG